MSTERVRRRVLLVALIGVAAVAVTAHVSEILEEAELVTIDARFGVRGAQPSPDELLVVGVDEATLGGIGEPWPFPVETYARTVRELTAAGASVIVVDIPFVPGGDEGELSAFREALEGARAVTLATAQTTADGEPVVLGGAAALEVPGVRAGDSRFDPDDDGTVRRFDHTLDLFGDDDDDEDEDEGHLAPAVVPTLPIVAAEQATARNYEPDATGEEGATIDHPGPAGTVAQVSLLSVIDGEVAAERIAGRIVVIGPTAAQLQTSFPTPLAERTSGTEIHAAAIATVLAGFPLSTPSPAVQLAIIMLVCLAPLSTARVSAGTGGLLLVGIAVAYLVAAQLAFQAGVLVPVVAPLMGLAAAAVAVVAVNFAFEALARRRVREVFGRYVPPEVVDDLVDNRTAADDDLLRATNRDVTVLFSDLRGFTTFSEERETRDVMVVLNAYLGAMADVIHDEGGMVMSYLGDGIIAVFGASEPRSDHADQALDAAVKMLDRMERFNTGFATELDGQRFRMGIGLNSGIVTAGNLGTVRRLAYTVIGDTVNTASRIEALTKDAPFDLLFSDTTRRQLSDTPDGLVEHATLPVRGRSEPIRLWSLRHAAASRPPSVQPN